MDFWSIHFEVNGNGNVNGNSNGNDYLYLAFFSPERRGNGDEKKGNGTIIQYMNERITYESTIKMALIMSLNIKANRHPNIFWIRFFG